MVPGATSGMVADPRTSGRPSPCTWLLVTV